jgi:hypothetical protein
MRILDGGPDEPTPTTTGSPTVARDAAFGYNAGDNAWRVTMAGAGTYTVIFTPVTPINFGRAQAIQAAFHVSSGAANITQITTEIHQGGLGVELWSRTLSAPVAGPNVMRQAAHAGPMTANWGNAHRIRLTIVTTGAAEFHFQRLVAEVRDSPELYIIFDAAYKTLFDSGFYAELKARNIPCHFALQPFRLGTGTPGSAAEIPTWNFLEPYAYENNNVMGIHSWGEFVTSGMTTAQIIEEQKKVHSWLAARGLPRVLFRDAWWQNNAPNHAGAQPYWLGYATPTGASALNVFPFINPYNVSRITLHGTSQPALNGHFTNAGRSNSLFLCYTHGVHPAGGNDMTPAEMTTFLTELDAAIATYGFRGVNQFTLYERADVKVQSSDRGELFVTTTNQDGTENRRRLAL